MAWTETAEMRRWSLLCGLILVTWSLSGCGQRTATEAIWQQAGQEFVEIDLSRASPEMLDQQAVWNNQPRFDPQGRWCWSEDRKHLYVRRNIAERCVDVSLRTTITPVAMTVDGISIVLVGVGSILPPPIGPSLPVSSEGASVSATYPVDNTYFANLLVDILQATH